MNGDDLEAILVITVLADYGAASVTTTSLCLSHLHSMGGLQTIMLKPR